MHHIYKLVTVVVLSLTWIVQAHSEDRVSAKSDIDRQAEMAAYAGRIHGNLQSAVNSCDGIYQSFGSDTDLSQWKRKLPKAFEQGFQTGLREVTQYLSRQDEAGKLPAACNFLLSLYGPDGWISPGHLVTSLSKFQEKLKATSDHS